LRLITELEREKVSRRTIVSIQTKWIWGDNVFVLFTSVLNTGTPNVAAGDSGANFNANNGHAGGAVCSGKLAGASTSRQGAGAAFNGAREVNGGRYEQVVCTRPATARNFYGLHGVGELIATEIADTPFRPGSPNVRAGSLAFSYSFRRSSGRSNCIGVLPGRVQFGGGWGGRTAH
jgi:hypothetical protein